MITAGERTMLLIGRDLERMRAEVHLLHRLERVKTRAEALRLLPHQLHQLRPEDPFGEAGIVLDVGGDGELPARLHALEDERH